MYFNQFTIAIKPASITKSEKRELLSISIRPRRACSRKPKKKQPQRGIIIINQEQHKPNRAPNWGRINPPKTSILRNSQAGPARVDERRTRSCKLARMEIFDLVEHTRRYFSVSGETGGGFSEPVHNLHSQVDCSALQSE